MNISKKEFRSYINQSLPADRKTLIDRYLLDHPLEKKALEGAIEYQADDSFDTLLDEVESSISEAINPVRKDLKERNSDNSSSPITNSTKIVNLSLKWLMSAAAVVLLLVFARTQFSQNELVLADYFDAYPDVLTDIVRGQETPIRDDLLFEAMTSYNQGDFETAERLLTNLHSLHPKNQNIRFYLAISEFAQGKYNSCLQKFESLTEKGARFQYDDGAFWYTALSLLHMNRNDEAKNILQNISTSNHYKKQEAIDLLKDL